ncbi:MAG TPA: hypothetical protein PK587_12075 [Syntrophales bacterium]|nr:hypothetical protein [Syntrophales bacterium]
MRFSIPENRFSAMFQSCSEESGSFAAKALWEQVRTPGSGGAFHIPQRRFPVRSQL